MKLKRKADLKKELKWDYQLPKINDNKQTIDEMSLIIGMYGNYLVSKTGNLIGVMEVSGVNLDLLNDTEQEDVFNDYNAFLMTTLGEGVDDSIQFIETTVPVNMTDYLNGLKKKYLYLQQNYPEQTFKIQLIASYIDHFTAIQNARNMTTKQHLMIIKQKIKDKSLESLDLAVDNLDEKMNQVKRDLENALTDFDLNAKTLTNQEVIKILKNLINYNG